MHDNEIEDIPCIALYEDRKPVFLVLHVTVVYFTCCACVSKSIYGNNFKNMHNLRIDHIFDIFNAIHLRYMFFSVHAKDLIDKPGTCMVKIDPSSCKMLFVHAILE